MDSVGLALLEVSLGAEGGEDGEIGIDFDLPDVFFDKLPLLLMVNHLNLVWERMSADFGSREHIHAPGVLADVKIPQRVAEVRP